MEWKDIPSRLHFLMNEPIEHHCGYLSFIKNMSKIDSKFFLSISERENYQKFIRMTSDIHATKIIAIESLESNNIIGKEKDTGLFNQCLYKMDFLVIYSHFETYLQDVLTDMLDFSKKQAKSFISYTPVSNVMRYVFNEIDPLIIKLLDFVIKDLFKFALLCYRLRNLYVDQYGIVDDVFIINALGDGTIKQKFIFNESKDSIKTYYNIDFSYLNDYKVFRHEVFELERISEIFYYYMRECALIVEGFIVKKALCEK